MRDDVVRFAHGDLLYELLAGDGSTAHGKIVGVFEENGKGFRQKLCTIFFTAILRTPFP